MIDIVQLLTGDESPPPSLDSMLDLFVQNMRFDFESAAWSAHYVDSEAASNLIKAYEALSEGLRLHFLLSPSVYKAIGDFRTDFSRSKLDVLLSLAEREHGVASGMLDTRHDGAETVWNPMGDSGLTLLKSDLKRTNQMRLDSLITLDFDSPNAHAFELRSPALSFPFEEYVESDRLTIVNRLQDALAYIDDVSSTLGRLIRNYTRTIVLRKREGARRLGSEHVTSTIGEIRLTNAHFPSANRASIADALVHESVHNLLSTLEYIKAPFVVGHDDKSYRPPSPWTGNPIPVASFCHAAFVWFALFHFASRELELPNLAPEARCEIERRRNACASGFLIPTPLSDCLKDLAQFNTKTLSVIDDLQRLVRMSVDGPTACSTPAALVAAVVG